jgi:hypothetical protein
MKEISAAVVAAVLAVFLSPVSAALIDRGDGFIYDDVLDITWTQNANINGPTTWDAQIAWVAGYSQTHSVYGTFDNWRLPSMDVDGDNVIVDCGTASETNCQDNEYGYLYHQYGISDTSPGLFTNVASAFYWSGTLSTFNPPCCAWIFGLFDGSQSGNSNKSLPRAAWAVMDGDIQALVPSTPYTVNVDSATNSGGVTGTYSGAGDAQLIGVTMSYTHRGEYRFSSFGDDVVILSTTGTFDLVAETGTYVNHDCVYVSGINNFCEIIILDAETPATVVSVSATSGSSIVVVTDDGQTEATHTFTEVVPVPAVINIEPTILHPHHDGRLGPSGIASLPDDVIPVVVFGASTAAGDPADLNTDDIDAATLSFGPGAGAISPSHPPQFNLDEDSDGIDDARFRFLMSDAAFDSVTCTDSSGTLAGGLTTGGSFEGSDTFTSDCGAVCHN